MGLRHGDSSAGPWPVSPSRSPVASGPLPSCAPGAVGSLSAGLAWAARSPELEGCQALTLQRAKGPTWREAQGACLGEDRAGDRVSLVGGLRESLGWLTQPSDPIGDLTALRALRKVPRRHPGSRSSHEWDSRSRALMQEIGGLGCLVAGPGDRRHLGCRRKPWGYSVWEKSEPLATRERQT